MGKVWVLDTETKGTGANVVPLEDVQAKPEPERKPPKPRRARPAARAPERKPRPRPEVRAAPPPPPGHVRKKATGELGKVRSVDARAGTATVQWLKGGHTSTVPISTISRR
ncbi:MAG TPA: hypothetical protein VJT75_07485 [Thermoleophilaceae bacterium]|nr:hypothetical protein [Thermoleophilaceae bacterium]